MSQTTIRGSTRGVRMAAAASLALVVAATTAACGGEAPAPPTARVQRGSVSTQVSASGALAAVTSQNLGFSKAAQLLELDVKVGDIVRPGQVLGRQDPFSFQQILNQYQAQLNNQRAILDRIVNGTIVHGDNRSLDQAKRILDATKENREAIIDRDKNSVDQAERALDYQRQLLRQARAEVQRCSVTIPPPMPACTGNEQSAVTTAIGNVRTARNTLETAEHTLEVDRKTQ